MKVVPYSYKQRCKFSSRPAACKLTDRLATLDADCCGGNSLAASAASASAAASSSSSESSCSAAAASAAAGELTAADDGWAAAPPAARRPCAPGCQSSCERRRCSTRVMKWSPVSH